MSEQSCDPKKVENIAKGIWKKNLTPIKADNNCMVINDISSQAILPKNKLKKAFNMINPFTKNIQNLDNERVALIKLSKRKTLVYVLCNKLFGKKDVDKMVKGLASKNISCSIYNPLKIDDSNLTGLIAPIINSEIKADNHSVFEHGADGFEDLSILTMSKKDHSSLIKKKKVELANELNLSPEQSKKLTKNEMVFNILKRNKLTRTSILDKWDR